MTCIISYFSLMNHAFSVVSKSDTTSKGQYLVSSTELCCLLSNLNTWIKHRYFLYFTKFILPMESSTALVEFVKKISFSNELLFQLAQPRNIWLLWLFQDLYSFNPLLYIYQYYIIFITLAIQCLKYLLGWFLLFASYKSAPPVWDPIPFYIYKFRTSYFYKMSVLFPLIALAKSF